MTIKGYPDKQKTDAGASNFATVSPVREQQSGLDVCAHIFAKEIATDTAESGSTTRIIVATAHAAIVGDIINWTSGDLDNKEYKVASVETDSITLAEVMSAAPAAGDAFQILRFKFPTVNDDGSLAIGATLDNDTNFGTPGADTLRTAAMLGVGSTAVSNSNPVPISDAGGAITVDGTVAATQSGVWTVQPGNTANTTAWKVDGSAVTQPVSGTFWQATQPVSGTVTVDTQTPQTVTTAVFAAEASIAFGSLTGTYASLVTPAATTKILLMRNNTNAAVSVSLDAGSTTHYVLDAGDAVSLDLQANALKVVATAIHVKYAVGAPTAGSFRVNGVS